MHHAARAAITTLASLLLSAMLYPLLIPLILSIPEIQAQFVPVRDYSGSTFFDQWNFFNETDALLTWGQVQYLNEPAAMQQRLTYINDAGNAIIRVDNFTNVIVNQSRNSIRLESKDFYSVGTIWIFDAIHMPYGCSVWPSFWTKGQDNWPDTGEIDIIEYVNLMNANQMAIHSAFPCGVVPNQQSIQSGTPLITYNCTAEPGCTVRETKPNSLGPGFAAQGGGVYAAQFDVSGVYIWFWSRPNVPQSIRNSTATSEISLADWGLPSAAWPATACNVSELFEPQQLVITITLCGKWADAGNGSTYRETCQGRCYEDNVLGSGKNYADAFFEIPFIRAYSPKGQSTITNRPPDAPPPASSSVEPTASETLTQSDETSATPTKRTSGAVDPSDNSALSLSLPLQQVMIQGAYTLGLLLFGLAVTIV